MKRIILLFIACLCLSSSLGFSQNKDISEEIDKKTFDTGSVLWYGKPAQKWEEALPVGNGRLGAMVFGKYSEERIQLNEETLWSGGPYSTVVTGGSKVLPEIQRLIFEGKPIEAHKLFGRHLMGDPVEQMKYQCLANLHLFFENEKEVTNYKRWLDLETATTHVEYSAHGNKILRRLKASCSL